MRILQGAAEEARPYDVFGLLGTTPALIECVLAKYDPLMLVAIKYAEDPCGLDAVLEKLSEDGVQKMKTRSAQLLLFANGVYGKEGLKIWKMEFDIFLMSVDVVEPFNAAEATEVSIGVPLKGYQRYLLRYATFLFTGLMANVFILGIDFVERLDGKDGEV